MVSLVEAIHRKYDELESSAYPGIVIIGSPSKNDSGRLAVPKILIMDCQRITSLGCMSDLLDLAGHINELDLSGNEITSWCEVHQLLDNLPCLEHLNVGHNPLSKECCHDCCSPEVVDSEKMGNLTDWREYSLLKTLVVNNVKLSWSFLLRVLRHFPNLNALYASGNNFGALFSEPEQEDEKENLVSHLSLTELYFNNNSLQSWGDLCHLGRLFPKLQHLIALDNALPDCEPKQVELLQEELSDCFPELTQLVLSGNPISAWSTVEALSGLPCMMDLKLLNVPLMQTLTPELCHDLLVARLGRLQRLNGSWIQQEERDLAERAYIRHYMGLSPEEQPPRFHELWQRHGPLEPLVDVSLAPPSFVAVVIRCFDSVGEPLMGSETCVVSLEQTVAQLKEDLCGRFCKALGNAAPRQVRLYYWDQVIGPCHGREEMKFLTRAFHSYQAEDGDELHLELRHSISRP